MAAAADAPSPAMAALWAPGTPTRWPLALVAVWGERVPLPQLEALGVAPAVLDGLLDAGILVMATPPEVTFSTPAVRAAILEALSGSERRRAERAAADLRAQSGEDPAGAAAHYVAAHAWREAAAQFRLATARACAAREPRKALAYGRSALRYTTAGEAPDASFSLVCTLLSCTQQVDDDTVRAELEAHLWRLAGDDPERVLAAHRELGALAQARGDTLAAIEHFRAITARLGATPDHAAATRAWVDYGNALLERMRVADALDAINRARERCTLIATPDVSLTAEVLAAHALALAIRGRHDEAQAAAAALLEHARRHERADLVAFAFRRLANISDYRGDYRAERDHHLTAIAQCRAQRETAGEQHCLACLSYTLVRTGEWPEAVRIAREVIASEASAGLKALAQTALALVATFRGERRQARPLAASALQAVRHHGLITVDCFALWALAFLAELDEDPVREEACYREVRALWREREDFHDAAAPLLFAAAFYGARRDAMALADCRDILHTMLRENPTDENRAACAAVRAEQELIAGDPARAGELFAAAVSGYDRVGSPIECVHVRWRLWRFHQEQGDPVAAATVAAPALALCKRLGMRPLQERFRHVGVAATPRRETEAHDGLLTRRQTDVLRAVGEGLTNKEIAARLGLSPRTVEMHVAGALERLACRTRAEAVRKASDEGLLD